MEPPPGVPRSVRALFKWPGEADAYLKDHFGLRKQLIDTYNGFNWRVLGISTDPRVVVGRNDRLFLAGLDWLPTLASAAGKNDTRNLFLLGNCGAWWPENYRAMFAGKAATALRRLHSDFPRLAVMLVPTSDLLYPTELPERFQQACLGKTPLVEDWLERLPPDVRKLVAYPIDTAKNLPPDVPLIPKHSFHWIGRGVSLFMEAYADDKFHLDHQSDPTWTPVTQPADLERFLPGAGLVNTFQVAEWPSGVASCTEDNCLHTPPLGDLTLPRETVHVARRCARPRLLLFSDSFGWGALTGLVEYFCDVLMINMNNFRELNETDRRALWNRLTENWRDARVLVVLNAGNITLFASFAKSIPQY